MLRDIGFGIVIYPDALLRKSIESREIYIPNSDFCSASVKAMSSALEHIGRLFYPASRRTVRAFLFLFSKLQRLIPFLFSGRERRRGRNASVERDGLI